MIALLVPACSLVVDLDGLTGGDGGTIDRTDASDAQSDHAVGTEAAIPDAGGSPYVSAVLADSPLAYYRFEEKTSAPAHDSSGNGHDGVYAGGVDFGVPGALANEVSSGIHLNGTTAWVSVGDSFHFAGRAPMTVEAWVNPEALGSYHGVVTNESADYRAGYRMLVSAKEGLALERIFLQADARATSADTNALPAPPLGKWTHVVATYDGTDVVLFVRGQEVMRHAQTLDIDPASGAIFAIGARASGTAPNFQGSLDEVAVYDHPLSAARIALHNALGQ